MANPLTGFFFSSASEGSRRAERREKGFASCLGTSGNHEGFALASEGDSTGRLKASQFNQLGLLSNIKTYSMLGKSPRPRLRQEDQRFVKSCCVGASKPPQRGSCVRCETRDENVSLATLHPANLFQHFEFALTLSCSPPTRALLTHLTISPHLRTPLLMLGTNKSLAIRFTRVALSAELFGDKTVLGM